MVNIVIIDENWNEKVADLAQQFNEYAKKHSLRRVSYILDKTFDIMADDNDDNQYDAAKFLARVRAVNSDLVSSYVSVLIDSKMEKALLSDDSYVVPNYFRYPASDKKDDNVILYDDSAQTENVNSESTEIVEEPANNTSNNAPQDSQDEQDLGSALISWQIPELLQYKIIKNLISIDFEEFNEKSQTKKCSCGDGKIDKESGEIWVCAECGTPYHENCAKITAVLEGKCRICDCPFLVENEKKQEPSPK